MREFLRIGDAIFEKTSLSITKEDNLYIMIRSCGRIVTKILFESEKHRDEKF
jgi:hypothetical protein